MENKFNKKINSEIGRTAISEAVRMKLWAVSGGRCELCNRLLYSDLYFGQDGNFAEMAHIHAVSKGGPRHKIGMTSEEKNNIDNLMLLCEEHHHLIDSKSEDYSEGMLLNRKKEHEDRIRRVTEITEEQSCRMVTYFSNIDNYEVYSSDNLLKTAVVSAGLYPKQEPTIELHKNTNNRYAASKENIQMKSNELEYQFTQWLGAISSEDCVAVFSLAPQPLLFKLGTLLNDQHNAIAFQCHRTGHKWAWKETDATVQYNFMKTIDGADEIVALVIDLSAEVVDSRVADVLRSATVYHITIDEPNRNFVTSIDIQNDFVSAFRNAMETIKNTHPLAEKIHMFFASPNSIVIRAGMDYMPKADLPVVLYEQDSATTGFFETITIGG